VNAPGGLACALGLAVAAAACRPADGGRYPSRPIKYLIAFEPGGQSDREARRQQPLLERALRQKVLIDYKVGAGGALCWTELARAHGDGYVIAGINLPHVVLQPLRKQSAYATDDLLPVAFFQRTPLALVVLQTSPYRTLDDLLRAARADQGSVSVGGSGTFSGPHLMTRRLARLSAAPLKYVPFNGSAPVMTNLLGGHTTASVSYSDDLVRFSGQIRVLALADAARSPSAPDAPTLRELGLDIVEVVDRGVAVPRGTPPDVVSGLEAAFLGIARDPAVRGQMEKEGFVPLAMGSAESARHIAELKAHYAGALQDLADESP
jgi:tripartite-type tricarboxylate transporter receptor subunit TctC